jgi:hypothetical protein
MSLDGWGIINELGGMHEIHEMPDGRRVRLGDMTEADVRTVVDYYRAQTGANGDAIREAIALLADDELTHGFRHELTPSESIQLAEATERTYHAARDGSSVEEAIVAAQRTHETLGDLYL